MKLKQYEIHRVHLPLPHPIGDSQVRFVDHWGTILELETDNGLRGSRVPGPTGHAYWRP